MTPGEQVLVIEQKVFARAGIFQGFSPDVERYLPEFFVAGVPRFMSRDKAETDSTFKQIIPYVIMECGGKFLSYVRGSRAGEIRLVGKRSIGIGGHINPDDDMPLFHSDFRDAYLAAVHREVEEEINVESPHTDSIIGLLNDDSTEVGRVHLGIVHLWRLEHASVTKREQMITQLEFLDIASLRRISDSLETWSALCLPHLEN